MSVNCTGLAGQEHIGGSDVDPNYLLNISDPFMNPDFPTPGPSHFNVDDINECAELCLFYRNISIDNCWTFNYHDDGYCHLRRNDTALQEDDSEGAIASTEECFILLSEIAENSDNGQELHEDIIMGLSIACGFFLLCCLAFTVCWCKLERRTRKRFSFEHKNVEIVEIAERKAALTISEKIDIALSVLEEDRRRKHPSRLMRLKDKIQFFPNSSVRINMTPMVSDESELRQKALSSSTRDSEPEFGNRLTYISGTTALLRTSCENKKLRSASWVDRDLTRNLKDFENLPGVGEKGISENDAKHARESFFAPNEEVTHIGEPTDPERKDSSIDSKENFIENQDNVLERGCRKSRDEEEETESSHKQLLRSSKSQEERSQESMISQDPSNDISRNLLSKRLDFNKSDSTKAPNSPNQLAWPPEGSQGICPPSVIPDRMSKTAADQETIDLMNKPLSPYKESDGSKRDSEGACSEPLSRNSFLTRTAEEKRRVKVPREVTEDSLNADDFPTPRRIAPSAPELYRAEANAHKRKTTFDILRNGSIFNFGPSRKQPKPPPITAVPRDSQVTVNPSARRMVIQGLPIAPRAPNPNQGRLSARLPLRSLILPKPKERPRSCTSMREIASRGKTVTIDGEPPGLGKRIRWTDL